MFFVRVILAVSAVKSQIASYPKIRNQSRQKRRMPLFFSTQICANYQRFTAVKAIKDTSCLLMILPCVIPETISREPTFSEAFLIGPFRIERMLMLHGKGVGQKNWINQPRRIRFPSKTVCIKHLKQKFNKFFLSLERVRNKKKKKLVGWYVARCGSKSKREGYINELKVYKCVLSVKQSMTN